MAIDNTQLENLIDESKLDHLESVRNSVNLKLKNSKKSKTNSSKRSALSHRSIDKKLNLMQDEFIESQQVMSDINADKAKILASDLIV